MIEILASGARTALAGRALGRLLAIVGDVVAARYLGPAVFGLYSIGWTIFRLMELIAPIGLETGVIRYGAKFVGGVGAQVLRTVRSSVYGAGLAAAAFGAILFILSPWLADNFFDKPALVPILRIFAAGVPFAAILTVAAGSSRLTQDMRYTVILQDAGQPMLAFLLLLAFVVTRSPVSGIVLSDVLSYAAMAILGLYFLGHLFPTSLTPPSVHEITEAGPLYRFSAVSSLVGVATTAVFWVDRLMVGHFLPAGDAGVYQAVSQISVLVVVVMSGLNRILIPMFAGLFHEGNRGALEEVYRVGTKWGLYICAPVLIVLLLSPQRVLAATYGRPYEAGAEVIGLLLIGQVMNLATGPVAPLLIATGHERLTFGLSLGALALNVVLGVVLIPAWGLRGAAAATSISLGLLYLGALIAARVLLGVWPYDHRYWKGIAAGLLAAAIVVGISRLPIRVDVFSLAIQLAAGSTSLVVMLLILGPDVEDRALVGSLRALQFWR